ncbi:MAG: alpha/beta hydrolase [Acidimicrobiia bacterium]|nr:alpha/beta hydrolase [Acidimicrobiia bacterium]
MIIDVDGRIVDASTAGRPFEPALPGIVFLHGSGFDRTVWQMQARYFSHHGFAVLVVDLPGHGRSPGPAAGSIEECSGIIEGAIVTSGLRKATIVGHSMGSLIALELGASESVERLILTGAALELPVHPELLAAAQAGDQKAFDLITAWGYGKPSHLGGHPGAGVWMTGGGLRLLERSPAGVLGQDLSACNAYAGGERAAGAVGVPTLVIAGSMDRMTPLAASKALVDMIPDSRLDIIEGAGHMMMLEAPNETLASMRRFLEG